MYHKYNFLYQTSNQQSVSGTQIFQLFQPNIPQHFIRQGAPPHDGMGGTYQGNVCTVVMATVQRGVFPHADLAVTWFGPAAVSYRAQ